jgi:hypothetical protein
MAPPAAVCRVAGFSGQHARRTDAGVTGGLHSAWTVEVAGLTRVAPHDAHIAAAMEPGRAYGCSVARLAHCGFGDLTACAVADGGLDAFERTCARVADRGAGHAYV